MAHIYDKIYGCIAASRIGSAMGWLSEGMSVGQISEAYGRLESLDAPPARRRSAEPRRHRGARWSEQYFWHYPYERVPGETEDGIERQKLICTAIIEKKGRITAADLAKVICRDVDVEQHVRYRMWVGDAWLYPLVQAGMPANYVGMFSCWPGIVSFTRSCHPIGLVNACNPEAAARDAWDVGMLYQPTWSTGLPTAAAYVAGIAEACKASATRDSVVEIVQHYAGEAVREEIDACLDIAVKYGEPFEMRAELNERFATMVGRLAAYGEEVLARGLVIFYLTAGNVRDTIVAAVNAGRDTDCTAAVAAGLSSAFSGSATIPTEWIETVDGAEKKATHTVSNRTCREAADGLYAALQSEVAKMKQQIADLEAPS